MDGDTNELLIASDFGDGYHQFVSTNCINQNVIPYLSIIAAVQFMWRTNLGPQRVEKLEVSFGKLNPSGVLAFSVKGLL